MVLGYSWGGGAALEFSQMLNDAGIVVDSLVLIDPVKAMRSTSGQSGEEYWGETALEVAGRQLFGLGTWVPNNVHAAVNFHAPQEGTSPFNGIDSIWGALNVKLTEFIYQGEQYTVNHDNIMNVNNTWSSSRAVWAMSPSTGPSGANPATRQHVGSWLYGQSINQGVGGPY